MGLKQNGSIVLHCDDKSAITMGKNPVSHDQTKHIAIKYHFIREAIEKKDKLS